MRTVIVPVPRAPRRGFWLRLRRLLGLPFRYWPYTLTLALLSVGGVLFATTTCWWPGKFCCGGSRIPDSETRAQALRSATTMYLAENPHGCPSVADLVAGGYLDTDKSTTDVWENPFHIECKGTRITVTSAGPDQLFGTDDDIR